MFPGIAATNSGNSGGNATQHTCNLPTGIAAGHLLVLAFANDGTATASVAVPASGWTQLFTALTNGDAARLTVFYRWADGAEASTIRIDTSASEGSAYAVYRITGAHPTTNPVAGTATAGASVSPNPPNLDPGGWGVEDTLWLSVAGWDGNVAVSAYPTNYTLSQLTNRWANTGGSGVALAGRRLWAGAEDPGVFTIGSEDWAANTIAIRAIPKDILIDNITLATITSGVSSRTVSHVTAAGNNRFMLVGVPLRDGGQNRTITSVTYHGVALSQRSARSRQWGDGSFGKTEWWGLVAPDVGTWDVVITFSGSVASLTTAMIFTLQGVDQTAPIGVTGGADSITVQNPSVTVTSQVINSWLFDCVIANSSLALTPGSAQAQRDQRLGGTGNDSVLCSSLETTSIGSYTPIWTAGETLDWTMTVVEVKPASIALDGTSALTLTAVGDLSIGLELGTGAAALNITATAALTTAITCAGSSSLTLAATAALTVEWTPEIHETFNVPDNAAVSGVYNWTEPVGGDWRTTNSQAGLGPPAAAGRSAAYINNATLSAGNQWIRSILNPFVAEDGTAAAWGIHLRHTGTSTLTCYAMRAVAGGLTNKFWDIVKYVNNVEEGLTSNAQDPVALDEFELRGKTLDNGDVELKGYVQGVLLMTVTDPAAGAILGSNRSVGIVGHYQTVGGTANGGLLELWAGVIPVSAIALDGSSSLALTVSGDLTTAIPLDGTSALELTSSAELTTAIPLEGICALTLTASADLTTAIAFETSIALTLATAADLTTAITAAGDSTMTLSASGELTTAIPLVGTAELAITSEGALTTAITVEGTSVLTLAASADLQVISTLSASAGLTLTTTGELTTAIALTGSAGLELLGAGDLSTAIALAGTSTLTLTTGGTLSTIPFIEEMHLVRVRGRVAHLKHVVGRQARLTDPVGRQATLTDVKG